MTSSLVGHEVAALEVQLARRLSAMGSPVAALEARVEARVYERDGFAVTWWTYYEVVTPAQDSPAEYAAALHRLHADLRGVEVAAPHVMERVAQAARVVANRDASPALAEADRRLLLGTLRSARAEIHGRRAAEQLLHGEPMRATSCARRAVRGSSTSRRVAVGRSSSMLRTCRTT